MKFQTGLWPARLHKNFKVPDKRREERRVATGEKGQRKEKARRGQSSELVEAKVSQTRFHNYP